MTEQPNDRHPLLRLYDQWYAPPAKLIGKLPRAPRRQDGGPVRKAHCDVCGGWHDPRAIHLDYLSHAEVTSALIQADPCWNWRPAAFDENGHPRIVLKNEPGHGARLVMWGYLTVHGVERLGVGTAPADAEDPEKEVISDFLKNAAMRFGIALSLWSKTEVSTAEVAPSAPASPDRNEEDTAQAARLLLVAYNTLAGAHGLPLLQEEQLERNLSTYPASSVRQGLERRLEELRAKIDKKEDSSDEPGAEAQVEAQAEAQDPRPAEVLRAPEICPSCGAKGSVRKRNGVLRCFVAYGGCGELIGVGAKDAQPTAV